VLSSDADHRYIGGMMRTQYVRIHKSVTDGHPADYTMTPTGEKLCSEDQNDDSLHRIALKQL